MAEDNIIRAFRGAPQDADEGMKKMIAMAEGLLERVKSGHITGFAVAALQKDAGVGTTWSCPYDSPVALLGALTVVQTAIAMTLTMGENPESAA